MRAEAFHAGREIISDLICCRPGRTREPMAEQLISFTERFTEEDTLGFAHDMVRYQCVLVGAPGPRFKPVNRPVMFEVDETGPAREIGAGLAQVFAYFSAADLADPARAAFTAASADTERFASFMETCAEVVHRAHHVAHERLACCPLDAGRVTPELN